jgi:chemotaxis family two-component system response regulator Rcp1
MRDARRPTDDRVRPIEITTPPRLVGKRAKETVEVARETPAHTHQALTDTRRLRQQQEEMAHHIRARRERQAEHRGLPLATAPQAGVTILLINDDPSDVALFRYVLDKYALPCRLTVLSQRSDVEAFFSQAATAAPFSFPRLIIAEYRIPGMEFEEIMAAVRAVPAYRRVPVILFSTVPEDEGQRLSGACGATMFVHKPGEWEALVRRCLRWCATGAEETMVRT